MNTKQSVGNGSERIGARSQVCRNQLRAVLQHARPEIREFDRSQPLLQQPRIGVRSQVCSPTCLDREPTSSRLAARSGSSPFADSWKLTKVSTSGIGVRSQVCSPESHNEYQTVTWERIGTDRGQVSSLQKSTSRCSPTRPTRNPRVRPLSTTSSEAPRQPQLAF
jgi:hypothetical protein